jgi:hypothetical protein
MVLLSNLFVIAVQPHRTRPFYAMLLASLVLNILLPADVFLALPQAARVMGAGTITFLPIFFAGVIFATAFRDSSRPDVDLGSNIGGVVLGGLSEYLSLVVGFNGLLVIACVFYLLAALLGSRARGFLS